MKHLLLTTIGAVVLVSPDEAEPSGVFWNDLKVHSFHLEMSEAEWEAMKALDPHKGLAPTERLKKINGNNENCIVPVFHGQRVPLPLMVGI